MAVRNQPWRQQQLFLLLIISCFVRLCSCQSSQNIETFYPFPIVPAPPPQPYSPPNTSGVSPSGSPSPTLLPGKKSSSDNTLVKAIAATAASTFVAATLIFFLVRKFWVARRRKEGSTSGSGRGPPQPAVVKTNNNNRFERGDGGVEGMIVDENGLDVVYWRKLEEENKRNSNRASNRNTNQKVFHNSEDDEEDEEENMIEIKNPTQEAPLLGERFSIKSDSSSISFSDHRAFEPETLTSQSSNHPPFPPQALAAISSKQAPAPPPPPPPPQASRAIPNRQNTPPPPPPLPGNKRPPPPPPPPRPGAATSSKISPVTKDRPNSSEHGESSAEGSGSGQVKLRPLHWDKVNKTNHSMVWDKIDGGSFRFDDDLMEALFGYVATNKRSPKRGSNLSNNTDSGAAAQIVILDPRKSQNIAIVLKSLGISHEEIVDALNHGQGLDIDTIEKLTRVAPTNEEQSQILEFKGDPTKLDDAESFLYHLLKAVPSAYTRLNAMHFRSSYETETVHFKESLQILELGCKELRTRGLFMKLLEAILKAGNRMNAGTSRGNAQAFKLTTLQKLSDVKSIDGKTTLLHFVVEEVVRSEGKRCVLNRNHSLRRTSSRGSSTGSNSSIISDNSGLQEEREREYKMLGLPVVGGLSAEFSNVKKAANVDFESFSGTCSALMVRATKVRLSIEQTVVDEGVGEFSRVMNDFLERVEKELTTLRKEQAMVLELVRKTTEYYQAGATNDKEANPLQLFVIIKDFLGMVDQVCVEIARNLQRRRSPSSSSSAGSSPKSRMAVRFPNLPEHFMKEKSRSSSSESDG